MHLNKEEYAVVQHRRDIYNLTTWTGKGKLRCDVAGQRLSVISPGDGVSRFSVTSEHLLHEDRVLSDMSGRGKLYSDCKGLKMVVFEREGVGRGGNRCLRLASTVSNGFIESKALHRSHTAASVIRCGNLAMGEW
jgi:hypothetical protein